MGGKFQLTKEESMEFIGSRLKEMLMVISVIQAKRDFSNGVEGQMI